MLKDILAIDERGRLKPAQQGHIQDSPVNQSQFADSENEHPPSQFGRTEQQELRAVEPETKEIHSQTADPPLCFTFNRITPIYTG